MTIPKSISDDNSLLSTADIAEELNVHRSTVHHWIKQGMLPSELHGSFHAVKRKDLKRFLSIYDIHPSQTSKKSNGKKRGSK